MLQQIIRQLDGELVRLKSLRSIVAGLAKSPSLVRGLTPRLDRILQAHSAAAVPPPAAVAEKAFLPEAPMPPRPAPKVKSVRGRGRPRGSVARVDTGAEMPTRVHRLRKPAEPTALSKAASAGPVVISVAALAREREARQAVKAASPQQTPPAPAPDVRPEIFARELAARWLTSPSKA